MAANGFIEKVRGQNGRIRVYRVRWRDAAGRHRTRTFDAGQKALAERFLVEVRAKTAAPDMAPSVVRTLGAFIETEWKPGALAVKAPATRANYESIAKTHIVEPLRGKLMRSIRPADVEALLRSVAEDHATETVSKVKTVLGSIWKDALKHGYVDRNILRDVELPTGRDADEDSEISVAAVFTAEETVWIASTLPRWARLIVLMLGFVGVRSGELAALKVADFEPSDGSLTVTKSASRAPVRYSKSGMARELKAPKTKASRRRIIIPEPLQSEVAEYAEGRSQGDWLFPGAEGGQLDPSRVRRRQWKRACEAAGVKYRTLHSLRHTAASIMIRDGVSVAEIARYLGHANAAITMRVYAAFFPEDQDAALDALGNALRNALK